jgi:hypothetical protein
VLSGDTVAPAATLAVVDGLMRTRAPHSVFLDILCGIMDIALDELGIRWVNWSMTLLRNSSMT